MSSPLLEIVIDADARLVTVRRTDAPIAGDRDVTYALGHLRRTLAAVPRSDYGILVDVRAASLAAETTFAVPMRDLRRELSREFARVAFLVQTEVGLLQVRRFLRDENIDAPAFRDEDAARKHATG